MLNIRAVGTPYSSAIADFYDSLVSGIPRHRFPTLRHPTRTRYSNLRFPLPQLLVTLPRFTLELQYDPSTTGTHWAIFLGKMTLNEHPPIARRGQADLERALYREAIRFAMEEVSAANPRLPRGRAGGASPRTVHPELDDQTYARFRQPLAAAISPVLLRALSRYSPLSGSRIARTVAGAVNMSWILWLPEAVLRVEEAVYRARRAGRAFWKADLLKLTQSWMYTRRFWPAPRVGRRDMINHLAGERPYIRGAVLPIVRQIQMEYLRRRP